MHYLPLVFLLIVVSLFSILVDRWRVRKLAEQTEAPTAVAAEAPPAATLTTKIRNRLSQQWAQRFGRKPAYPDDPVRAWLATIFVENPAERVWFAALSPEQFALLRQELADFCSELGFDLIWLVEQATFKPAVLEATGKTIVTHYCRAVRAAVVVHEDMKALQRYQDFLTNPTSKENLAFGQQLYTHLVDAKLASPAAPELLMASEKERQLFAVQAIQAAAEQNEAAFSRVLKAVAMGDSPAPSLETTPPALRNGAAASNPVAA